MHFTIQLSTLDFLVHALICGVIKYTCLLFEKLNV